MKKLKNIDFLKLGEKTLAIALLFSPLTAFAIPQPNCNALNGINCQQGDVQSLLITVLNWLLGIAFIVAVLFLVIGGFRYIMSAGNEEQAEAGKKTIINALIGVVVIILSYVIVQVVARLVSNSGTTSTTP